MERRRFERFALDLPTEIEIATTGLEQRSLSLTTTNLSAGGAFFRTSEVIPTGTRVELKMVICCDHIQEMTGAQGCLEVDGTVVRCDALGIAVCFDENYKFSSSKNL
jgi:c-di-GMP-binding flagellar brake protein YcgR